MKSSAAETRKVELENFKKRFPVAVIPLPDAVLFPKTSLSLHVFGRRDQQVIRDVMANNLSLAVALLTPQLNASGEGAESGYILNSTGVMAEIQTVSENEDGTLDIQVVGTKRVKLVSMVQRQPYFVMEAEHLDGDQVPDTFASRSHEELKALAKAWVLLNPNIPDEYALPIQEIGTFAELTDYFAFNFLKRVEDKQTYLSCLNPVERAEKIAAFLETDLVRLSRKYEKQRPMMMVH